MDASTNTMMSKIGRQILVETPIEIRIKVSEYADRLIRESQIDQDRQLDVNKTNGQNK